MFKKALLEEEAFLRLERLFKGRKGLWSTEAEATFHADLVWVQVTNGCVLLVKLEKWEWAMLTAGNTSNATRVLIALLHEIWPETAIVRETSVPVCGDATLKSLGIAKHFLFTLKTRTDLQSFPSPIPDFDIETLVADITEVIREAAALTNQELTCLLEEGEHCMARRYLELGISSPGGKASSAKTSPESAADTTHIGTSSDLASLAEEPITSPVAASTGPLSSWTFLPPNNRIPEGEQDASRWTIEDSDSRSELFYIEFSRLSSRGPPPLTVEESEPCQLVTPRFRLQPEGQRPLSLSSLVSVPLDSPEKEDTEVENTMGRVFQEPLRQRIPDSLSRDKYCKMEEGRPQPCTCSLL